MKSSTALVLSGGGSRGAYQAGAWKALDEAGCRPRLIVGTSAGALNAAMVAAGLPHRDIERWWGKLRNRDILRLRRDAWRWKTWLGFHTNEPLRRLLEQNLDIDAVRSSRTELVVTAVDLELGGEVVFLQQDLTIDHLMASAALLPGLPPVKVEGRLHADGGHWNALPLRHALERGHTEVAAILHDPLEVHHGPAPTGLLEMLRRVSDVTWHAQQDASLQALRLRTRLPRDDPERLEPFALHAIAPDPPLRTLILRFDPEQAKELYKLGYEQARAKLDVPVLA